MKRLGIIIIASGAVFLYCYAIFYAGYRKGRYGHRLEAYQEHWEPKVGDRVVVTMTPDANREWKEGVRVVTLIKVVRVGLDRCQTGLLVYGDGLPGVDSSWVKPAP